MVYITRALVDVLIDLASDADPDRVGTGVSVTPARKLEGHDADVLPPQTPVFTDFLLPDPGNAVNAVFGVDLSTPARQAQGQFVSHPIRELEVTKRDDLAEVVFVAVPPWSDKEDSFAAFDRMGERQPLEIIEAQPPEQSFSM
ncbi:hypothetical protein [Natronobacterium gregoryi]|uniref:Uncharacterized protein n=2 Tax=Natronobacterium gregoryi TaxID=44930 RepID=L0AE53_NATGS|nr:hypothetical protein [Natronobacterium gregoryi]AFZ71340.1 hypothetical protein Natgr_0071 [Natronobacterium gregoryi SP2]ELY67042.1 hypothetical protein C490_11506 [Natronobacterium gregoryi SP2]PLK21189.1 hypothetical protein CYV19_05550 [Natronobacterium gregoryi SP2]SFI86057.1 hypothetical protein SAMN05443661_10799 [Natronobacterium gregoryi]